MKSAMAYLHKFFGIWFSFSGLTLFIIYCFRAFTLNAGFLKFLFFSYAALAICLTYAWQRYDKNINTEKWLRGLQLIIRFSMAYLFIFYAMGKLYDLQFKLPEDMLNQPAKDLDGFSKAWIFFAHSYHYSLFIAAGQILASVLLLSGKAQTTGALLFFGITANIAIIDFAYGIVTMQAIALLLLCMSIYLLACDGKRIIAFLLSKNYMLTNESAIINVKRHIPWSVAVVVLLSGIINDLLFYYKISQGG